MNSGAYYATRYGHLAKELLVDGRRGRIAALFKSSFYLQAGGAIACIGNHSLHACSLNVNTSAPGNLDWSANGLKTGSPWRVLGRTLYVGGRFCVAMHTTDTWAPSGAPRHWRAMDLRRSVVELRRLCGLRAPQEGLARAVVVGGDDGIKRPCLHSFARAPVNGLRAWLTKAMKGAGSEIGVCGSDHPHGLQQLVGLGPGLTPSGDDFLSGVMFTLHKLGLVAVSERLWGRLRPLAMDAGNAISFGHLAAAAEGGGSAPIDELLGALLGGESGALRRRLDAVDTLGHTSGWDCVAGVLTATECWLAAQRPANHSKEAPSCGPTARGVDLNQGAHRAAVDNETLRGAPRNSRGIGDGDERQQVGGIGHIEDRAPQPSAGPELPLQ